MDMDFIYKVIFRSVLAVIIGSLIGTERSHHGSAAGTRTHILVCLGAALTSMISVFILESFGQTSDLSRISAQVISGIGFLGAGMIILKSNKLITGLTTAAGVWTTSVIGIAIGYGFYSGAVAVTILVLITVIIFAKFEKSKKSTKVIYIELDDMYKLNHIVNQIKQKVNVDITYSVNPPKSMQNGHVGLNIFIRKRIDFNCLSLLELENVVFVEEE